MIRKKLAVYKETVYVRIYFDSEIDKSACDVVKCGFGCKSMFGDYIIKTRNSPTCKLCCLVSDKLNANERRYGYTYVYQKGNNL